MTVKNLKALLENMDESAVLVVPTGDHSYNHAHATKTTALYDGRNRIWSEDHGEDVTPEADYGKRLPVLVIQ